MTSKRILEILRFFHAYNNAAEPPGNTDRLLKVRPVITYLVKRFQDVYIPEQHLSLDEGSMKWRGRLSFKVYNPSKPDKYAVKLYILAEARTGYVHNFEVYCGEGKTIHNTVHGLMGDLRGKGYRLFMDNYYNSVALCESLREHGTDVCVALYVSCEEHLRSCNERQSVRISHLTVSRRSTQVKFKSYFGKIKKL